MPTQSLPPRRELVLPYKSNPAGASNAPNYAAPVDYQINPRTGTLQVSISPPSLPGFLGAEATPAIEYSHDSAFLNRQILGLPLGWLYSYSFILESKVYINGKSSFFIDAGYPTGLRYYTTQDVRFLEVANPQPFPYDPRRTYSSVLRFVNGDKQYFDSNGRMMGMDDRFGNHVVFEFDRDANVTSSRVTRITDSIGQITTIDYSDGVIRYSYPRGAQNSIEFLLHLDDESYLVSYADPLGQRTAIESRGGQVRHDLVSKISFPNGLVVSYDYGSLKFREGNDPDFFRLDCVVAARATSSGVTRLITYDYDPEKTAHNFTGYPKFAVGLSTDTLLLSGDNDYRYVTRVDDGILITEHSYNRLHLEMETCVYTRAPRRLLSRAIHRYPGQQNGDEFPLYNDLRWSFPNYQAPSSVSTEVYGTEGSMRRNLVESDFNDFGQMQEVRTYRSQTSTAAPTLLCRQSTTYDYPTESDPNHFGLILKSERTDYSDSAIANGVTRRTSSTLTPDNKCVETTATAFVEAGQFNPKKQRRFEYDFRGRIIFEELKWTDGQVHDPQSSQTRTEFIDQFPVASIVSKNALDQQNVTELDAATGWIIAVSDALGSRTSFAYDNVGRRISQTDPLGVMTTWSFDDAAGKDVTRFASGYETYLYRNAFGDPTRSADNGAIGTERTLSTTGYNELGQKTWEQGILGESSLLNYRYDDQGQLSTVFDALGNTTQYEHDLVSQTTTTWFNDLKVGRTETSDEVSTSTTYSTHQNEDSIVSETIGNGFDRTVESRSGTSKSGTYVRTQYEYGAGLNLNRYVVSGADGLTGEHLIERDLFGNVRLETVIASGSRSTRGDLAQYNAMNQLVQENNPLGQIICHTYDAAGRQLTMTDYSGTTFTSNYLANNQVESIQYSDVDGHLFDKRFSYDPTSEALVSVEEFIDGQSLGKVGTAYTLDGHIKGIDYPDGRRVEFNYDAQFARLTRVVDALGNATHYEYDSWGRVRSASVPDASQVIEFEYYTRAEDPANSGRIKWATLNSSLRRMYRYDGYGAVSEIIYQDVREGAENNLWSSQLTYALPTMNLESVTTRFASALAAADYEIRYRYNSLNQLVQETTSTLPNGAMVSTSFEYDAANNVKRETCTDQLGVTRETVYDYDADNKLLKVTGPDGIFEMRYDANGNLISDGRGAEFGYDLKGKLIRFKPASSGPDWRYTYYANELRASKQVDGSTPIRLYYDAEESPSIVNEQGAGVDASYLMLSGDRPLRMVKDDGGLTAQALVTGAKDVLAVFDAALALKTTYSYSAYGAQVTTGDASGDVHQNPFQYSRQYTDAESGLIYLRSRYYHPGLKRFVTRDTSTVLNRYVYGDGNPINGADPTGEIFGIDDFLVAMAVSAIIGAAVGATIGGVTTRSWKGALFGAVAGGVGGAVSFGVGAALTGGVAIGAGLFGIAVEEAPPVVGALIGATTGAVSEAAGGAAGQLAANAIGDHGSVGQAALLGAAFGVVIGGATGYRATFRYNQRNVAEFDSAPRGQRGQILNRISPRVLNRMSHSGETWRRIGTEVRKPGGYHEWLVVEHFARFRAMGYTLDEIRSASLRTETDILELRGGDGTWAAHGGSHPFINNAVGASRGPVSLNRAVRGISSRVRVSNGAGGYVQGVGALPSGFRSWLPPIGRMLRMPFSIAYGVQGRVWV